MLVSGHSAQQIGADWRGQTCEHCSKEFCYWNVQIGQGEAVLPMYGGQWTKDAASREASGDLLFRLKHYGQLVRCAHCGKFQAAMIGQARQEIASRTLWAGFILTVVLIAGFGIASLFVKDSDWLMLAMLVSGFLGTVLTGCAWVATSWFDPNRGRYLLWRRDKETESKAITREAYEALMREEADQTNPDAANPGEQK